MPENPDIKVNAIDAGNYDDTRIKARSALNAGGPAQFAVMFSIDACDLIEQELIVAFDDLPGADAQWLAGFYPALMANGRPGTALRAVCAVTVWEEAGFFMIFYLAALQTIPPDLKEAAEIEGASRFTYTRRIVLPLLMLTTLFILDNAMINSVKLIDHLFILTKVGPCDSSALLLYHIRENAFAFFDAPHAAAMTVLVLMVLGLLAAFQFFVLDRGIHCR